jgi:acetylornithine/N-succinyldiaminopimelate aminotransferase
MGLAEEKELESRYLMHAYAREDVQFTRGEMTRLFDDGGREYLDFLAGIAVVSVGHCNPRVTAAIVEQAEKLVHVSNYFHIEKRGQLARRLSEMLAGKTGADGEEGGETGGGSGADAATWKTFFANSGAEANEGAVKLARRWGAERLDGAWGIVTARRSFHGRTLATLAATAQDRFQDPFAPLPPGFSHVPLNDVAALEAALDAEVDGTRPAALLLEPVQGESGVWPCTREYMQAARRLTEQRGMLLVLDEVQTGLARTGKPFCFQRLGVVPDVVTMAKGIANGVPMGAFSARGEAAELLQPGMHGSTFGGSALAVAAADATTQIMCEPGFCAHVAEVGDYLSERLAALPFVTDVRGAGLMVGASIDAAHAHEMARAGLAHGLVFNAPADDVLRFLPPLVIERADVDALVEKLPECYEEACR